MDNSTILPAPLPTENLILFDWLTFSTRAHDERSILELLGLSDQPFQLLDRGRYGYSKRLFFENISILFDGSYQMGVCVDMSGQGCRAFESFSTISWDQLFFELRSQPDDFNISRLDCAFDDHTGLLDIDVLRDDTDDCHYRSRFRGKGRWKVEYGSAGCTIYHGSDRSDMRIRIYDKAAERDLDEMHWIRVEMQMRDVIASGFIDGVVSRSLGEEFRGVLRNYLCYVDPVDDVNMSRWPLTSYWDALLEGVGRISCWSAPGLSYDIFKLRDFVINQCGNPIDCYLRIFGSDDLLRELGCRSTRRSPKYERLLEQYSLLRKEVN